MKKIFPKQSVDLILEHLGKKGLSFREMQQVFNDIKGYRAPSLGYIHNFFKKNNSLLKASDI